MTRVGDEKKFLDAGASESHTIRPGLDGHHVTDPENVVRPRIHPRGLVNEETHAVTHAVGELPLQARRSENPAAGGVDFARHHTRSDGGDTCFACGAHDGMAFAHLPCTWSVDHEGTGHVGVVAVDESAEIDDNGLTRGDATRRRMVMRQCCVVTGRDDRRKTDVIGTVPPHCRLERIADVRFAGSRHDSRRDLGQRSVGDLRGSGNAFDLGL